MLNFKCLNCQNDIQTDNQLIGDTVQCPFCTSLQIVPDPILFPGSNFNEYTIIRTLATSILWTTYEVSHQPHNIALCIPTAFFLKRVSDLSGFANKVAQAGSLNRPELPALIRPIITPESVYFLFEYQNDAYNLKNLISNQPLNFNSALAVVRKIAVCLSQIWEHDRILHLCLNPENISITNDLNIRIKNIGMSEYFLQDQKLLESGFNIWDYKYLSPEFITDGKVDSPACDIYSLGGILFLLCTGHEPYENIPPENILNTPMPLLKDYLQEIPENLVILLQMMMAHNPESRFTSWKEVIKHLDTILANQIIEPQIYYDNNQQNKIQENQPVGFNASELTQNISRKIANQGQKTIHKSKKTTGQPVAKHNPTIKNKKKNTPPVPQKITSTQNDKNFKLKVIFSVAATLALIVVMIIVLSGTKKKKIRRKKGYKRTTQQDAYAAQLALIKRNTGTAPTSSYRQTPKKQTVKKIKQKSSLNSKLLAIDEYHLNNPNKTREVSKRYKALIKKAEKQNEYALASRIQEKIELLPHIEESIEETETVDVSNEQMKQKIETVIAVIKRQIHPLLQNGKQDEALTILREYDGELAEETRTKRLDLAVEIEGNTEDNASAEEKKDSIVTEEKKQEQPQNKKSDNILKKVAEKFTPSLFKGKILDAKVKLELAGKTANTEIQKTYLTSWLKQIDSYEKLKPELEKYETADQIITSPENQQIMENAYILQGLLYKDKEQFLQAKQAFMKLPYGLGNTFVENMEKSLSE